MSETDLPERILAAPPSPRRSSAMILFSVLMLSAAVRLGGLHSVPLWVDEFYTYRLSGKEVSEILKPGGRVLQPGYPLLAKGARLFGDQAWLVRVPAFLGGIVGVAGAFWGLRVLGFAKLAPFGALFIAGSVYHVYYSQEARAYTCMSSLVALATFLGAFSFETRRVACSLGALGLAALACAFHVFAAPSSLALGLVLSSGWGWVLFRRNGSDRAAIQTRSIVVASSALALFAVILFLMRERLGSLLGLASRPASTNVVVNLEFISNVVDRWSGLGLGRGRYLLVFAALGILACWRRSFASGALLSAVIAAPFLTVALMPWPTRFEARYVMAPLIPVMVLICVGIGVSAQFLVQAAFPTPKRERNAYRLSAAVLVSLLILESFSTAQHVVNPRKYAPVPQATTAFGERYIIFHNITNPWMIRSRSGGDFATTCVQFGPVAFPLPEWEGSRQQRPRGPTYAVENSLSDDRISIELRSPRGKGYVRSILKEAPCEVVYQPPVLERSSVTQRRIGKAKLVGECPELELKVVIHVWSARLPLVEAYLGEVAGSACAPERVIELTAPRPVSGLAAKP